MKTTIRLAPVLLAVIFLTSCSKKNDVVVPQNPIVGSWILTNADEGDGYTWQPYYTGLENGIFDIYSNGTADYDDGQTIMQGSWYMRTVDGPYYDQNGAYQNGLHNALEIHIGDYTTHASVDINFDDVEFIGNRFVGTYDNGTTTERYWFSRY